MAKKWKTHTFRQQLVSKDNCSAAFTKQVIIINKNGFMWPPQKFENVIILSITSYIYENKTKVTTWKFSLFSRLCSENKLQGTQYCVHVKSRVPSIWFKWKNGDFQVFHGSKSCRHQGPLGSAGAQPWFFLVLVQLICWILFDDIFLCHFSLTA